MKINIIRSKLATQVIFLVCGVALAAWAPMVPYVKDRLSLDDRGMGVLLLFLGAGAIVIMPISGWLIHRTGSRLVVLLSSILTATVLAALLLMESRWSMAVCLFLFGAGLGAMDVSMNTHGIHIQNLYRRPIMSSLHGLFSVGGIIGPLIIILLASLNFEPHSSLCIIAVLLLITILTQLKFLMTPADEREIVTRFSSGNTKSAKGRGAWRSKSVLFLGTMCFIAFLAEGAILDWSAIFLRDYKATEEAFLGLGYASFSIAMAFMRLLGDRIVARVPKEVVVIAGSITAAGGIFLAVFTPWLITVLGGFVLVGLGAANIVPIFFSEGGKIRNIPATTAIAAISTMGYAGQLIGPAALGFIAEQTSLSVALIFTGCLLIVVAVCFGFRKSRIEV